MGYFNARSSGGSVHPQQGQRFQGQGTFQAQINGLTRIRFHTLGFMVVVDKAFLGVLLV